MTLEELKARCKAINELLKAEEKDDRKIKEALGEFITQKGFKSSVYYEDMIAGAVYSYNWEKKTNKDEENRKLEALQRRIEKILRTKSPSEKIASKSNGSQSEKDKDPNFDIADEADSSIDWINDLCFDSSSKPSLSDEDFKDNNTIFDETTPVDSEGLANSPCSATSSKSLSSDEDLEENDADFNDVPNDLAVFADNFCSSSLFSNEDSKECDTDFSEIGLANSEGPNEDSSYRGFEYLAIYDNLPIPLAHRQMLIEKYGNNKSSDEIAVSFHMPKEYVDKIIRMSFEQLKNNSELREQYMNLGKEKPEGD